MPELKPEEPISTEREAGQIVVLGMHRSGTSCLTGCLVLAGASVGYSSDLTGVSEQNPRGFWERRDLRNFCDALLHGSDADWWKLSAFSPSDVPADVKERAFAMARPALAQLSQQQPWVAKEPRFCVLLPLLLELVEDPVCVHMVRNPLEVARSLHQRNAIPILQGIALWELYNQMAVRHSEHLRIVRIDQDTLLADPRQAMRRLVGQLQELGVDGLHEPNEAELADFVDLSLHRQQSEAGEERAFLTESQQELWRLLRSEQPLDSRNIPPLSRAMLSALEDLEVALLTKERAEALQKSLRSREAEIAAENRALKALLEPLTGKVQRVEKLLHAEVASLRRDNLQLGKDYANRTAKLEQERAVSQRRKESLDALQTTLNDTNQTLRSTEKNLAATRKEVDLLTREMKRSLEQRDLQRDEQAKRLRKQADLTAQLRQHRDQLQAKNRSLEASRSWRITRPLRSAADLRRQAGWLLPRLLRNPREARRLHADYRLLSESALFDRDFYLARYPDVGLEGGDPVLHFLQHGAREGRDPSAEFSTRAYLEHNPDVRVEDLNPLVHFLEHGQAEGRKAHPAARSKTQQPPRQVPTQEPERRSARPAPPPLPTRTLRAPAVTVDRERISVDVVVPVHNALEDVRRCLEAVLANSSQPFHLYVVNDGSDTPTSTYLREVVADRGDTCTLIEHADALGYTRAANAGLRCSKGDYVVLLNSDTIVPVGWLEKLLECGESAESIGIVGPLSNAASYQSVPRLRDGADWMVNELPPGLSVNAMAALVDRCSEGRFPRVQFLNGFCYAIKRQVIDAIGLLDEESFPRGYGEENDYSLRARDKGFELAVAENLYVFHAKSKSFTHETRRELAAEGRRALDDKHGAERVRAEIAVNERSFAVLESLRGMLRTLEKTQIDSGGLKLLNDPPISVLFLLMGEGGGGGGHSIVQEASGLRRLGVHAVVAAYARTREKNLDIYSAVDPDTFFFFDHEIDLIRYAERFTTVVATHFKTMETLQRIRAALPHVMPAYYAQDYEPWIVPDNRPDLRRQAEASYTAIPGMLCFAKTNWIRETVQQHHQVEVEKVTPSLDTSVYSPELATRSSTGPVHVVAMVRPATPRRAPVETMRLLERLRRERGDDVRISIFGTDPDSSFFDSAPQFDYDNFGVLVREEVAALLGSAHVFVDLSTYQAFGRTGLEAMAVGCVPVLPGEGGVYEYAIDGCNARIVDTKDLDASCAATLELCRDKELREKLAEGALQTAARYGIGPASLSELLLFRRAHLEHMVSIIVPIYNAHDELRGCLDSVLAHTEGPYELLLIDDCSTDSRIWPLVEECASKHSFVRALRNAKNLGYTRSVNIGCAAASHDVVLLNSDTLVTPGWLGKLRAAARSRERVATVTPLSNAAGAFSVPVNNAVNVLPEDVSPELMARWVSDSSEGLRPVVPTGNGFCLYITRQAIDAIGLFDEEHFPRGYGEENDFCMRADAAGYVNLIEDGAFVFHHRSASFGEEKTGLAAAGSDALRKLHPDYKAKVQAWLSNDPLDVMRARLQQTLAAHAAPLDHADGKRRSILYVLHNGSGGTLLTTLDLFEHVSRHYECHLLQADVDSWKFSRVVDGELDGQKTIEFAKPWLINELPDGERRKALRTVLEKSRPDLVHIRHLIGSHPSIISLLKQERGLPVVVSIHDMYSVCPTIQLFDDTQSYCEGFCTASDGECRVSRRWFRRMPPLKHAYVHDWRGLVGRELALADALVVTSQSARDLIRRHYPFLRPERFELLPHGRDLEAYHDVFAPPDEADPLTVVFFGALGAGKGIHFVHEMLKLNQDRGSPVRLHILGDASLPFEPEELGAVYHGSYERDELPQRLSEIRPAVSILPSIGPETYCHALTEAWACGIPVLGSSLGAVGERLQAGGGWILPPTDPARWLDKLVALGEQPAELGEQHERIASLQIPTVQAMALSYLRLYQRAVNGHEDSRALAAAASSASAGARTS